jgi:hypothetical protein
METASLYGFCWWPDGYSLEPKLVTKLPACTQQAGNRLTNKYTLNSSWFSRLLKMGPIYCPEMSVTANQNWVKSQKAEDLKYVEAEAWNLAKMRPLADA